jgi:hypothetical protein
MCVDENAVTISARPQDAGQTDTRNWDLSPKRLVAPSQADMPNRTVVHISLKNSKWAGALQGLRGDLPIFGWDQLWAKLEP